MLSKFINKGYEADQCEICETTFNLLKLERIHKCKRCSKYVCAKCGSNKQKILNEEGNWTTDAHRVCSSCSQQLNQITDLIENNKMAWNQDSLIAKDWISRINEDQPKDYEYNHFLKLFYSNSKNFEEEAEIIDKDVIQGRTDYSVFNYSLKEFFFILQQNEEKVATRQNIANVLYAIAARYDQIGYVQGMSSVAAYLLCFAKEETAYTIYCDLIENIFPRNFFVKGNYGVTLIGLLAETYFLKEYFVHLLVNVKGPLLSHERESYSEDEIDNLKMIVELSTSKAFLSLFVSFLSYGQVDFIWSEIKRKRSFEVAERAFLATLYLSREMLIERKSFKDIEASFEAVDLEMWKEAYFDLEIDKELKDKLLNQYYEDLGKKWRSNSDFNIRNLHKCTSFSEKEIKFLQESFLKDKEQPIVIKKEDFVKLIKIYYQVLKEECKEDESILEITSHFVSRIFEDYNHSEKEGLDFREFVCCLSVCTKSQLKDRMCAIIHTFQDRNKQIKSYSFEKLISSFCQIAPSEIEEKKEGFLWRMKKYFAHSQSVSINELYILLNDEFINELSLHVTSSVPGIVEKTVYKYLENMQ